MEIKPAKKGGVREFRFTGKDGKIDVGELGSGKYSISCHVGGETKNEEITLEVGSPTILHFDF